VDQAIKSHLAETAKWGKFLAIVGFIMCGIILIAGIVTAANIDSFTGKYGSGIYEQQSMQGLGIGMIVVYIVIAILYFFPCLYLLRFSNKMKTAIAANDQVNLTEGFRNLKVLFRYVGILTIIMLCIYLLALVTVGITGFSR
jgi:hypothetical protein